MYSPYNAFKDLKWVLISCPDSHCIGAAKLSCRRKTNQFYFNYNKYFWSLELGEANTQKIISLHWYGKNSIFQFPIRWLFFRSRHCTLRKIGNEKWDRKRNSEPMCVASQWANATPDSASPKGGQGPWDEALLASTLTLWWWETIKMCPNSAFLSACSQK